MIDVGSYTDDDALMAAAFYELKRLGACEIALTDVLRYLRPSHVRMAANAVASAASIVEFLTALALPEELRRYAGWCVGRLVSPAQLGIKPGADLREVDLSYAKLCKCDLTGADLSRTMLRDADCKGAKFAGANCKDADFTRANCNGARFDGTNCHGTRFDYAKLQGASFAHADCAEANLIGANCTRAKFQHGIFVHACFDGAICSRANFENANFAEATFHGAKCANARVRGAYGLHDRLCQVTWYRVFCASQSKEVASLTAAVNYCRCNYTFPNDGEPYIKNTVTGKSVRWRDFQDALRGLPDSRAAIVLRQMLEGGDSMNLMTNADLSHPSATDLYYAHTWELRTQTSGKMSIQEVDYDWLNDPDHVVVDRLLAEHNQLHMGGLTEEEADIIVRHAREVRRRAEHMERTFRNAIAVYQAGDTTVMARLLDICEAAERAGADIPFTNRMREQLLLPSESTSDGLEE